MENSDDVLYRHSQIGYVTGGLTLVALAALGAFAALRETQGYTFAIVVFLVLLGAIIVTFSRLTCVVTRSQLRWYLGVFGWPGRAVPVSKIASAKPVQNPWYYGWGIRVTPVGILWNVSGTMAVEVELVSGGRVRIGTDQPQRLATAIGLAGQADR